MVLQLGALRDALINAGAQAEKADKAAVLVSTGCSVARNATPQPFSSWTMSCRSFNDRARRSMRVTTRVSPG